MPPDPQSDHVVRQMRDAILDNDLKLVQLVNRRIQLVRRLRDYKEQQGIPFVDPERERWMHQYLRAANQGPVSGAGLDALYDELLALTKRETAEGDPPTG
jgi:chorismate mutase